MKFVVDAQLPRRLCAVLADHGHEACHTLDLPDGNRTVDTDLSDFADGFAGPLITKDGDFVLSYLRFGRPGKLLPVSTGNIDNQSLLRLFTANIEAIAELFESHRFLELSHSFLVAHD